MEGNGDIAIDRDMITEIGENLDSKEKLWKRTYRDTRIIDGRISFDVNALYQGSFRLGF